MCFGGRRRLSWYLETCKINSPRGIRSSWPSPFAAASSARVHAKHVSRKLSSHFPAWYSVGVPSVAFVPKARLRFAERLLLTNFAQPAGLAFFIAGASRDFWLFVPAVCAALTELCSILSLRHFASFQTPTILGVGGGADGECWTGHGVVPEQTLGALSFRSKPWLFVDPELLLSVECMLALMSVGDRCAWG